MGELVRGCFKMMGKLKFGQGKLRQDVQIKEWAGRQNCNWEPKVR